MKAQQLDNSVNCPVCAGTGDEPTQKQIWGQCPRCDGTGSINRYSGKKRTYELEPGVQVEEVIIWEEMVDEGDYARLKQLSMPETDEQLGGFDGMFGDFVPPGLDTAVERPQPIVDRLQDASNLVPADAVTWARNTTGVPDWYGDMLQRLIDEQPTL